MKTYNAVGYSLIVMHVLGAGFLAPPGWGFLGGAIGGVGYLIFIWFLGGLYLSDVMHMGIAHKTLDYRAWFINAVVIIHSLLGIYVNPTTWVNRHRHHHAFSDRDGDPNKLHADGFWRTMYLCVLPYKCKSNLAKDPIFTSWSLRLTSTRYFCVISQTTSFVAILLVTRNWLYSVVLWASVRVFALWINMIQNYWTHDRRFGTRRYDDERDNAMNLDEWLPVTASFSASLQNNHHHFPHFLRTSHADDEYDFGLMTVRLLKRIGLVKASPSGAQLPEGVKLTHIGF
jgi:sn-1 stearoyl-lipid 9-desaturase